MSENTVRRRTIARGAAWAVPVIAVGAAAPALAASLPAQFNLVGGCKFPGQSCGAGSYDWGYRFVFEVVPSQTGALCGVAVTAPGDPNPGFIAARTSDGQSAVGDGQTICAINLTAGVPVTIEVVIGASNSAQGTVVFTYSINNTTGEVPASFVGFHPCDKEVQQSYDC